MRALVDLEICVPIKCRQNMSNSNEKDISFILFVLSSWEINDRRSTILGHLKNRILQAIEYFNMQSQYIYKILIMTCLVKVCRFAI